MHQFLYKILFALSLGLIAPQMVFGAELFFEQGKGPMLKDQFKMGLFIEAEEPLNAIEGKIIFPSDLLELQNADDGNSIINFWLEQPTEGKSGEIIFSGITPGGYIGNKGLIFSMTFFVKQEGVGIFTIHDARVLRNDGNGTEAMLEAVDSKFVISKKTTDVQIPVSEIEDFDSPESFVPEIASDPNVFDGKWFLVFATQDKGSGIDHYKVKESRQRFLGIFSTWNQVESPYILQDQKLMSYIFVKSVDKAGNTRIEKILPQNPIKLYTNYENWFIIILGFAIVYVFIKIKSLWRKHQKNKKFID